MAGLRFKYKGLLFLTWVLSGVLLPLPLVVRLVGVVFLLGVWLLVLRDFFFLLRRFWLIFLVSWVLWSLAYIFLPSFENLILVFVAALMLWGVLFVIFNVSLKLRGSLDFQFLELFVFLSIIWAFFVNKIFFYLAVRGDLSDRYAWAAIVLFLLGLYTLMLVRFRYLIFGLGLFSVLTLFGHRGVYSLPVYYGISMLSAFVLGLDLLFPEVYKKYVLGEKHPWVLRLLIILLLVSYLRIALF